MKKKQSTIIVENMIKIKGSDPRHIIVKKVVNTFITKEYRKKGKGITFRYSVENLQNGRQLFITRPGHKKNFDFKVDVDPDLNLGEGSHLEIAKDLRNKKNENPKKFQDLFQMLTQIYNCTENDVDKILQKYSGIKKSFKTGAKVNVLLKVIKWLFIMEDIVYWDNEGRAFLFNFLKYVAEKTHNNSIKEVIEKVENPDRLKSSMKKANIDWIPCS